MFKKDKKRVRVIPKWILYFFYWYVYMEKMFKNALYVREKNHHNSCKLNWIQHLKNVISGWLVLNVIGFFRVWEENCINYVGSSLFKDNMISFTMYFLSQFQWFRYSKVFNLLITLKNQWNSGKRMICVSAYL